MILPATCEIGRRGAAPMVALLLCSSAAFAQPERRDPVAAEALFSAARKLVDAGDYAAGCPKFEAALALYPSASTMINIARCHEHEGKIATAWQDYHKALSLNGETQGEERRRGLGEIAQKGINDLAPRLPKLRIVAPNAPPGLKVLRDGNEITAAALDQELPADPGQHEVRASAPGSRGETLTVTLEEGKTTTVNLALKPATPDAKGLEAAPSTGALLPTGIALLVLGAGGLGVGAATGVVSLNKISAVKARCGGPHCLSTDTADQREVSAAMTLGDVSTATFIAGGALAAAGAVLVVIDRTGKRKPASDAAKAASVGVSVGLGHVTFQGRF